jgi:hypothetical protein
VSAVLHALTQTPRSISCGSVALGGGPAVGAPTVPGILTSLYGEARLSDPGLGPGTLVRVPHRRAEIVPSAAEKVEAESSCEPEKPAERRAKGAYLRSWSSPRKRPQALDGPREDD